MAALFDATGEDAAGATASTATVCAALIDEQHGDGPRGPSPHGIAVAHAPVAPPQRHRRPYPARRWGAELYEKPGYVRRQEKFFVKVKAKHDEQFHRMTNGQDRTRD